MIRYLAEVEHGRMRQAERQEYTLTLAHAMGVPTIENPKAIASEAATRRAPSKTMSGIATGIGATQIDLLPMATHRKAAAPFSIANHP
ncbi:hypothetical protein [Sphingomonas quercus]|uniref:Uncharacterized protein n=1 Tax=Sphingomonas quercus TaxID=2842451 RepID=A0ABS6BN01_9SPHN|nr:hypothetical protein [Sphingomonas quercus]MBU3078756.1 hypothetical protein [Sphingomonas quercus]